MYYYIKNKLKETKKYVKSKYIKLKLKLKRLYLKIRPHTMIFFVTKKSVFIILFIYLFLNL